MTSRFHTFSSSEILERHGIFWRVKHVLPQEGIAALYGPSGSGKSFLALDLAASISKGDLWFGHKSDPCSVAYVALEGAAGLSNRVRAYNQKYLSVGSTWFVTGSLNIREDAQELAEAIQRTGYSNGVVIIDTLAQASPGADENSSQDMSAIICSLKYLQRLLGGLVLIVHHSGKDPNRGLRGHSSLFAALDSVIEVSRRDDYREWKLTKAKDGRDGDSYSFKLAPILLGEDEDGDPITSCVIEASDSEPEQAHVKGTNQAIAIKTIFERIKAETPEHAASAPIRFEVAVEAVSSALQVEPKRKRERATLTLNSLIKAGRLCHVDGWISLPQSTPPTHSV